MCNHLKFDFKKAVQCLNYLAMQNGGRINKLKALKLVFLADRYHLRKFGRPITNDEYWAMPFGPVASGVKDIAEMSDFLSEDEKKYASEFLKKSGGFDIESIQDLSQTPLSESDIEALAFSWEQFGGLPEFRLSDLTHQYPEWKKFESQLKAKECTRARMNYIDFFEDPPVGIEKCFPLTPQEKADQSEYMEELNKLEALWGCN